ncbi:MAG: alpha-N-arabinofuranosidase, partial [Muribaculaceae bacterium]|nr:alpha-N-arabinofuranosidase [Muribaculaceae bacterium]
VYAVSLTNVDLNTARTVEIPLDGIFGKKTPTISGEILTCGNISDYNDFGQPEKVTLKKFDGAKVSKDVLTVNMPAKSIVTLILK